MNHPNRWTPEHRCACGALIMMKIDGDRWRMYDNDPTSTMGPHECPGPPAPPPHEWYEVFAPCCGEVALQWPDGTLTAPDGRSPHRCPGKRRRAPPAALPPELAARSLAVKPGPPKRRRGTVEL